MRIFAFELKKIMWTQKGLFYILAVLLLGTFRLAASDIPQNSSMEQYHSEYEQYLKKVCGICTEDTEMFLEQEAAVITNANHNRQELAEQYYSGSITKEEYERESKKLNAVTANENGFEVIYQQYLYICENSANRYFLQTNGWSGLFSSQTLDFSLFLVVLFLVTAAFCSEYSCQMDTLILTSKEGLKSTRCKLIIVIVSTLSLCVLTALIRYTFFAMKYGLPCGNYPMQSIVIFGTGTKELSLLDAYLTITALRCFGYVFFAVLLLFLSTLVKKYVLSMLLGTGITLIPYIGLPETVLYRLPIPLPFMLATDYLTGSVMSTDTLTGKEIVAFQEVSASELLSVLTISFLIGATAFICLVIKNRNHWQRIHSKRYPAAILSFPVVLLLTGCSDEGSAFRRDNAGSSYEVIFDPVEQTYSLKNSISGITIDLARSPLLGAFSEETRIMSYYLKSSNLYYTVSETEGYVNRVGNHNSNITKVSVIETDLETLQEKIIFEKITTRGRSLLGIEYESGNQWEFLNYHQSLFVNDRSIFFADDKTIMEVSRITGQVHPLDIDPSGNIAFDGHYFYYTDNCSVLTKYDTQTGETVSTEKVIADIFCDESYIYMIPQGGGDQIKLPK